MQCRVCKKEKPREQFPPSGPLCLVCRAENNRRSRIGVPSLDGPTRVDPMHGRIRGRLRQRLCKAIARGSKQGSAVGDLGCSIEHFKDHIAAQFQPGMSWDNYGEWHLDHIKPLSRFDLEDREQFVAAVSFENYQPLWAFDNLSKGAKENCARVLAPT